MVQLRLTFTTAVNVEMKYLAAMKLLRNDRKVVVDFTSVEM